MDQATVRGTILVVFDQVSGYQNRLLAGIRSVLTPLGVPMVVYCNDPYAHGLRAPLHRLFSLPSIAGVITTVLDDTTSQDALTEAVEASGLPAVHLGWPVEGRSSVGGDNVSGMAAVVTHLVDDLGLRRIALVRGIEFHADAIEREQRVYAELAARGIYLDPSLVMEGRFNRDTSYESVQALLRRTRDVDAIIALNDLSAAGVVDAVLEAGLRVPEDIAVTGFDDDTPAEDTPPGLTTVSTQAPAQGARAARLLLDELSGAPAVGHVLQPAALVQRGSTPWPGRGKASVNAERQSQRRLDALALMDRALSVNRALMSCRSVDDLLCEMAASMTRLGLRRCFLVLNDDSGDGTGSVVLTHTDDSTCVDADGERFPLDQVLPPSLGMHLSQSCLMLQPLSVDGSDLGYVLFEQAAPDRFVWEQLRMDLSRAISTLQETRRHAQALEALVAVRTAQLEAEVANRIRAERELLQVNQDLLRLTNLDGLTDIANRSAFDRCLQEQWSAHLADGQPLSVLLVDIDHFKELNDGFGHLSGDRSLQVLARCLREAVWSPDDLAARYGGDEFAAILPHTDAYGATAVAHRLRVAVAAAAGGDVHPFTISVGAATLYPGALTVPTDLVAMADSALYEAKQCGRDRVIARTSPQGVRPRPSSPAPA